MYCEVLRIITKRLLTTVRDGPGIRKVMGLMNLVLFTSMVSLFNLLN